MCHWNVSPTVALVALAAIAAGGCQSQPDLTTPSAPFTATPVANDLGSARALVNSGPSCIGARTPGFYCQNQDGTNPNLTSEEFELLATDAAAMLGGALGELSVGEAVCIKGNRAPEDQLVRHLAALALNLAANLVDETTPLVGAPFTTVGEAFAEGVATASDPEASKQERNAVKDVIDEVNNNVNTTLGDECGGGEDDGDLNR